ncbi:MAG: G1 family glutamic endopeptidase [Thermoplasmataceae archaeon]
MEEKNSSWKKRAVLLATFILAAGLALTAVSGSVVANTATNTTYVHSDVTALSQLNMPTYSNQLNVVKNFIKIEMTQNHEHFTASISQAKVLNSAGQQLAALDSYVSNHGLNVEDFSVSTVQNVTSGAIHVYLTHSYTSGKYSYEQTISLKNPAVLSTVSYQLSKTTNVKLSSSSQSGNWDGYSFYNPHPWYYFGGNYAINWVSEGITVPSVQTPPSSQINSEVPMALAGWDSLSSNSEGSTMVQAGWYWSSGSTNPQLVYENLYSSATIGMQYFKGQSSHPIHFGDYMYIYIQENSTAQYYIVITDITNDHTYSTQVSTANDPFTPYYFGSVIEAPDIGGTIAQIPEFSSFQVNSLAFESNGNTMYGGNQWSSGDYAYYYLQQSSNGQNMNNQFQTTSDGLYDMSWANSYYSISYMQSNYGVS